MRWLLPWTTGVATFAETKSRQLKRMFAAIGHPLTQLARLQIGCVALDESLAPGEFRKLTREGNDGLKAMVGLIHPTGTPWREPRIGGGDEQASPGVEF